jgi:predicted GIY-YIG superfamily endonuclease
MLGHCAYPDRAQASRAEYAIKQLTAPEKRALGVTWTAQDPG